MVGTRLIQQASGLNAVWWLLVNLLAFCWIMYRRNVLWLFLQALGVHIGKHHRNISQQKSSCLGGHCTLILHRRIVMIEITELYTVSIHLLYALAAPKFIIPLKNCLEN